MDYCMRKHTNLHHFEKILLLCNLKETEKARVLHLLKPCKMRKSKMISKWLSVTYFMTNYASDIQS